MFIKASLVLLISFITLDGFNAEISGNEPKILIFQEKKFPVEDVVAINKEKTEDVSTKDFHKEKFGPSIENVKSAPIKKLLHFKLYPRHTLSFKSQPFRSKVSSRTNSKWNTMKLQSFRNIHIINEKLRYVTQPHLNMNMRMRTLHYLKPKVIRTALACHNDLFRLCNSDFKALVTNPRERSYPGYVRKAHFILASFSCLDRKHSQISKMCMAVTANLNMANHHNQQLIRNGQIPHIMIKRYWRSRDIESDSDSSSSSEERRRRRRWRKWMRHHGIGHHGHKRHHHHRRYHNHRNHHHNDYQRDSDDESVSAYHMSGPCRHFYRHHKGGVVLLFIVSMWIFTCIYWCKKCKSRKQTRNNCHIPPTHHNDMTQMNVESSNTYYQPPAQTTSASYDAVGHPVQYAPLIENEHH